MSLLRKKMQDRMALRGFAPKTEQAYTHWIVDLAKFHHKSPDRLGDEDLKQFMLHLVSERRLAAESCRQAIHAIRFFYAEVLDREISKITLPIIKKPQKIPELLNQREVRDILSCCDNLKYRTMMMLCYGTGVRRSEVVALRLADIDSDRQQLRVEQSKGRKDRYVLLGPSLLHQLRCYWQSYRPFDFLFCGRTLNQPITASSLNKMYSKAKGKAGITKRGNIHALRHAFATHSLEAGMPLAQLQQLMGHGYITTTLRYVHWLPRYQEHPGACIDLITQMGEQHA